MLVRKLWWIYQSSDLCSPEMAIPSMSFVIQLHNAMIHGLSAHWLLIVLTDVSIKMKIKRIKHEKKKSEEKRNMTCWPYNRSVHPVANWSTECAGRKAAIIVAEEEEAWWEWMGRGHSHSTQIIRGSTDDPQIKGQYKSIVGDNAWCNVALIF